MDGSQAVVGRPLCVIVGDDAALAAMLVWSLPMDQIDGYLIFGAAALAHLGRLPGCLGVIEADLASPCDEALADLDRRGAGRAVVPLPADDAGCEFLGRMEPGIFSLTTASPAEVLATLRDKWSFEGLCRRLDILTPTTRLLGDKSDIDIDAVLAAFGGQVVIKPTGQRGGRGVVVIGSPGAFRDQVLNNPAYRYAPLIAQAWIPGRNIGVSLLARDGEILHCALHRRNRGQTVFVRNEPLFAAVQTLIAGTRFSGLANFDARLDPDGRVYLLECNPRPWASLGQSSWAGLNFVRAMVQLALGRPSTEPTFLSQGAAPHLLRWWLALAAAPWRWRRLPDDQKRLATGALRTFAALSWRGRWRKLKARLTERER